MKIKEPEFFKLTKKQSRDINIFIKITLTLIALFLGLYLSGFIYYLLISNFNFKNLNKVSEDNIFLLLNLYSTIGMTIVLISYAKLIEKRNLASMGFTKKNIIRDYIKGLVKGFLLLTLILFIIYILGGVKILGFREDINKKFIVLYFIGFIFQGMSEEVIFRGLLMNDIAKRLNLKWAIILNSLIFSVFHLGNFSITKIALLNIFLVGVAFSLYMIKYENIWIVSAMHSMWNFTQANIYSIPVSGEYIDLSLIDVELLGGNNIINGGEFGIEGSIVSSIVFLILIYFLLQTCMVGDRDEI